MAHLNTAALLKQTKLRLTDSRKEVLEVLQHFKTALSHADVEKKLLTHIDRVTTYRTLLSFKEKGLIHSIIDPSSGATKYLFNDPGLPKDHNGCLMCIYVPIIAINSWLQSRRMRRKVLTDTSSIDLLFKVGSI